MIKLCIGLHLAVLLCAAPVATANPGVVFEVVTTDHERSPPRVEEMEIRVEGPNLAIPISSSGGQSGNGKLIFRGDRGENGEVVIIDEDSKTYYVMDGASARAIADQVGSAMSALEEALKKLPKEQREIIEKARQEGAPGVGAARAKPRSKPEVRRTGERGEKAGYPCFKYEVLRDGQKIREIWTTDWDKFDGGDEARDAFRGMGAFFEAMWKALPPMLGSEEPFGGQNPYDEMNFANGFPVVTIGYGEDGRIEDESWLKTARRERIDPSAFKPPSGYERRSMVQ